ncbi:Dinucleoside triphosphate hydrolase [Blastocladiella emersonii ATCC 22665]|nr:Dinucleoside triphosphate hydrolase [Blastocladiella emersonii ATCC 22665]
MSAATAAVSKVFQFGKWTIPAGEVFLVTRLSYAMVNFKPILPGHVLVCPRRLAPRFSDLTSDEVTDLWLTAQTVGRVVEREYEGSSLTFSVQDGVAAGQTVHHVHIHVIPRRAGDFENNDDIYTAIEGHEKASAGVLEKKAAPPMDNEERPPRTLEDMMAEAKALRGFFEQFESLD